MTYFLHLLIFFSIYAILALSLDLVVGYCGLLTLAHAVYFAVGGYSYAIATMTFGWGFLPAAAFAMLVGGLLSLAISLPAWRFQKDLFVLVTLAVGTLLYGIVYNWSDTKWPPGTLRNLGNGSLGLAGIVKPTLFGKRLETTSAMALLSSLLLLASGFTFWRLKRSPWGRLLKSMRDDELAARALGKNVRLTKVYALAVACAFAALSGTMYSSYVTFIDPSSASLDLSILLLCMLIVGGSGNFRGPIVGVAVLLAIPEALRLVDLSEAFADNLRLMIYGILLILMVHLRPQGLAGEYKLQ